MPPESPESPATPRRGGAMPTHIGRYRIVGRVGRGAMGVVYAAHDDTMGRPVAVKVLMADLESDPETRKRFYREAQAAAGLLHPNIITIYDAGEDQGRSYIAMQLLEGWPLAAYLKRSDATLERKLDLMVQMCEGLAVAHGRGIVHRDLKPGNLFVQSDGLLKILDFGVARLADSSMTATGMMLGTPDYMSPEQARGATVDARSDIFSIGAVFYFMLAGRKPFPGPDLPAVLRQLAHEQPEPLTPEQAPPELSTFVVHAMAKEPGDRPARVQDLLASLVRVRRQYEAATRRLAAEASTRYTALVRVLDLARHAGEPLGLPLDEEPSVLGRMRRRHPGVIERPNAPVEMAAGDRPLLEPLVMELRSEEERLTREANRRTRARAQLAEGIQALEAGDALAARRLAGELRAGFPSSAPVIQLYEECGAAMKDGDVRDVRAQALLESARAAYTGSDWKAAAESCQAALVLVPGLDDARQLLSDAEQATAAAERERAQLVQQSLDTIALAIREQRFDQADALLGEIDRAADPIAVDASRRQLAEARQAATQALRLRQLTSDHIRRARGAFRRGRYDEAIVGLRRFAAENPSSTEAADEGSRLERLRQRLVESGQARARQTAALVQTARTAAEHGRFDEAITMVADALRRDPASRDAALTLDQLMARELDTRLERARQEMQQARDSVAAHLLTSAHAARARGHLASALEAALAAERMAPGRADVTTCVAELRALMSTDDDTTYQLEDTPFPPMIEAPVVPDVANRPGDGGGGGATSLRQWAAGLFRRSSGR